MSACGMLTRLLALPGPRPLRQQCGLDSAARGCFYGSLPDSEHGASHPPRSAKLVALPVNRCKEASGHVHAASSSRCITLIVD